jgi:hypothetical protein
MQLLMSSWALAEHTCMSSASVHQCIDASPLFPATPMQPHTFCVVDFVWTVGAVHSQVDTVSVHCLVRRPWRVLARPVIHHSRARTVSCGACMMFDATGMCRTGCPHSGYRGLAPAHRLHALQLACAAGGQCCCARRRPCRLRRRPRSSRSRPRPRAASWATPAAAAARATPGSAGCCPASASRGPSRSACGGP